MSRRCPETHVHTHVHVELGDEAMAALAALGDKLDVIIELLTLQGAQMATIEEAVAELGPAVANLQTRLDEDWVARQAVIDALTAQNADLRAQLEVALGNDAADQAAIADALAQVDAKQAEIDSMVAALQPTADAVSAATAAIDAIDLDPGNPAPPPPEEPPAEPPAEG